MKRKLILSAPLCAVISPLYAGLNCCGCKKSRLCHRLRVAIIMAAVIVGGYTSPSFAQGEEKTPADTSKAQVRLKLEGVDIRVLISTVAEVSGKNFIVDPRVKGKINVISGAPVDSDLLYDVFLSVLEVHNYATVESGGVIKILPANVIKQRPTPFGPSIDNNDVQITQIIQLKFAAVQELTAIVRPLLPPTSHFAPHVASNSVVVTGTAANIQRVLKIIKRVDIPRKRAGVHVVYLEKTKASDLANTLTQIITSTADPKIAGVAKTASIQALDSIGALVINATDDEYVTIQALIDELDIERKLDADINVIYLKHAKAEDLVSVLNDVTKTDGQTGLAAATVQADEATNALIVKAAGFQLQTMREVIEKLDRRREQVFVETIIAEVSLDQSANLGITWGAGGARGGTAATPGADGDAGTPGTAGRGNLVNSDNPNQILGTATLELGAAGLNYSLLDFEKYQFDVVINALRADTNSNILSTPTILTLDNEEAEIIVGQEVPFVTGRFNNSFNNSTSTDAAGNVVNTSGNNFQTIERKDVGIKLKIKPQISEGDTIQLEVLQEISSVAQTAVAGQADLITNRRSIEATVQVDDGQVIVLGGLIQDDVVDTVNRVPFLGKIPLLGVLFRSTSKTVVKRNLMVFLKPRIVRTAEDLTKFSKVKYDEVRRDGGISRQGSSNFLIEDSDPPVLDEYENVINDGQVTNERRKRLDEKNAANSGKRGGLRALFSRKKLGEKHRQIEETPESDKVIDRSDMISEPIEWDSPPAPTDNDLSADSAEAVHRAEALNQAEALHRAEALHSQATALQEEAKVLQEQAEALEAQADAPQGEADLK